MTIDVDTIRPLGERILVKAYERPKEYGLLVLPDTHLQDKSWSLWEVVKASGRANDSLGVELGEGDILKTKVVTPVDTHYHDVRDNRRLFFVLPDVIERVIPCEWGV